MASAKRVQGEKVLESLSNRLLELDSIIDKENRHRYVTEEDTEKFINSMKNKNTVRKMAGDMLILTEWLKEQGVFQSVETLDPDSLDNLLAKFFMSVRKEDKSEYEPDSVKSIQCSISRYLKEKRYPKNILTDDEFQHSRAVLCAKRKALKQLGMGNKQNRADPFSDDELTLLSMKGLLGRENPEALINSMWLNNTLHFGLRGRQEHVNMLWGDLELKKTSAGVEYVEFNERATKTRSGATNDVRQFPPKMFAKPGEPDCPVALFKEYTRRRPVEMLAPGAPFYLGINRAYLKKGSTWFIKSAIGKNTIGKLARVMSEKAHLQGRHVNHSGRKTAVTKLVENKIPANEIMQLTGHKNIQSINNYSSINVERQQEMSNILASVSAKSHSTATMAMDTSTVTDNELLLASQELESALEDISSYERAKECNSNAVDLPLRAMPTKNLKLSTNTFEKHLSPQSIFSGCTFNAPITINFDGK